ncbi:MAG: hypothetical protein ACKO3M_08345 [Rubrivivax sp.]
MASIGSGRLGVVAYAFEPRRRPALRRALRSLAGVAPWPAGSRLAIVRRAGQPPFGDPGIGLPVQELEDDGQRWEFGAWQTGLDALRVRGEVGAWLLLNDTVGVNDPWPRADRIALRQAADVLAGGDHVALAGGVTALPAGSSMEGQPLDGFVQSQAFVLSAAALRVLGGSLFDAARFEAPRVWAGELQLPSQLSPTLAAHIIDWLTRPGKHGWRHHSGRAELPDELLRSKAGSILLEKRLMAGVLAAGGVVVDCRSRTTHPLRLLARRAFYWRRRLALALPG